MAERVSHGGHNIPSSDIERRFPRSLRNLFDSYRMVVNRCVCYLNVEGQAEKVFAQSGDKLIVFDQHIFEALRTLAGLT
ncbi:MAG: hypothetical protein WDN06_22180 [Asticcacaulis sp.]